MGNESRNAWVRRIIAPMHQAPSIRSEQVSQVLHGYTVALLEKERGWYRVRSEDGYEGWINAGYLHLEGEPEGERFLCLGGQMLGEDPTHRLHLPWGIRLWVGGDRGERFVDGSELVFVGELLGAEEQSRRFPAEAPCIVESARRWLGVPYLWGGVTTSGVDCSGFVQMVFGTHGVLLPRDARLQAARGLEVSRDSMRAGDLLFFADGEGVDHVALAQDHRRLIHASLANGAVMENDLEGDLPYEEDLRCRLVSIRRLL